MPSYARVHARLQYWLGPSRWKKLVGNGGANLETIQSAQTSAAGYDPVLDIPNDECGFFDIPAGNYRS
jgi:hypothetical protein